MHKRFVSNRPMAYANRNIMQELRLFFSTPAVVHICILKLLIKINKAQHNKTM